MRVLVTGATGFIGRRLVPQLLAQNIDVVGLAFDKGAENHSPTTLTSGSESEIEVIQADLRQSEATNRAVAFVNPDRVVHLAAAGVANPAIEPEVALSHNLHGTLNLVTACFRNRDLATPPQHFMTIRTPGESKPSNAYAASKAAAWSFCQMFARRYGWPITAAMVFQAYGPDQPSHTFVQAALRSAMASQDFAMTSGVQCRDWIFLDDVVSGLVAALAKDLPPGETVELGTGRQISLLAVAELAFQVVSRGGRPLVGALPDRAGEEIDVIANVAQSEKLIGWRSQVALEEGLRMVLDSIKGEDQKKAADTGRLP